MDRPAEVSLSYTCIDPALVILLGGAVRTVHKRNRTQTTRCTVTVHAFILFRHVAWTPRYSAEQEERRGELRARRAASEANRKF